MADLERVRSKDVQRLYTDAAAGWAGALWQRLSMDGGRGKRGQAPAEWPGVRRCGGRRGLACA